MTPEERREYNQRYYTEHREYFLAWARNHRAEITERSRATRAAYYNANRETINAKQRERYKRRKAEIWAEIKKKGGTGCEV